MSYHKKSFNHVIRLIPHHFFGISVWCYFLCSCPNIYAESAKPENTTASPVFSYRVINTYRHDPKAFTQGLIFEHGILYEGTGLYGRSSLRKVDLETGKILQVQKVPKRFFGEGVTVFGDRIIQLTWKSGVGFIYDKNSLELIKIFNFLTDGWGITHNGVHLIMSDGTATLYFLDPYSFKEIHRITVSENNNPVTKLNELEYIEGEIFANVFQTDSIVKIDPKTGNVTGWIDLKGLLKKGPKKNQVDVLNGIAFDKKNRRLFVTGKLWPNLFEIELIPEPSIP